MSVVIQVDNLSKHYRLGLIGGGTLREDLHRWWAKALGRPDSQVMIGQEDHGNRKGGEIWALRNVSLQIREGEILGIIGRNGSGKSTLLKIISRITAPSTGVVKIKGRIASLLEVGTGFHPELTGRENIYLNGAILGMKKREITRKFDEIVEFSGVEKFIDTPVKRYSSGMYVRLAFAVAAHLEPEILIVDEVLAVGDAEFQRKCLGKMSAVAHEGRTVLFVSHNMAAVENLCTNGIVLQSGLVRFDGTNTDAISNYLSFNVLMESLDTDPQSREGNGFLRIHNANILNCQGKTTNTVRSGEDVVVSLDYVLHGEYTDNNVVAGISVYNLVGARIFTHSSRVENKKLAPLTKTGKFTCHIPHLPLPPSNYLLGFAIKVDEAYADAAAQYLEFSVTEGDYFKTGRTIPSQAGLVYVSANWGHSPSTTM